MKNGITVLALTIACVAAGSAQTINWRSMAGGQTDRLQLMFGFDYGVTAQLSYSRIVDLGRPVAFTVDYSFPMGNDIFDDFKVNVGGQVEVLEISGFSAAVKIASNFRRYENAMVSIVSFGSDFALVTGYYSPTWHAAGEFGFDKSITSHLKHSEIMRSNYPAIQDGWYLPSGGHYYYGLQAGKTLGESLDLSLRLGATKAQFQDVDAVLPLYLQLGLGVRF